MTTTITLDVGDLHRWTEIEGEATAEYKTAFFATDAHLRGIRPFILSPDAQGSFWKTWERDMEAGLSNLICHD